MAMVTADHLIKPVKYLQQALSDAMMMVEAMPDVGDFVNVSVMLTSIRRRAQGGRL